MRQISWLTSCACLFACATLVNAADASLLWYDKPATDWEKEALPIGNGRMGAMVFGGVETEHLQISEKSLWTGGPGSEDGYDFGLPADSQAEFVKSIGSNLLNGAQLQPEGLAAKLGRKMHNYGDYQSFGDLIIDVEGEGDVTGYRRELDLNKATARVKFSRGFVGYYRDYFVSYPDQVLVSRWVSTSPQKLRARIAVPDNRSAETRVDAGSRGARLTVSGALKSNGLRYSIQLLLIPACGTVVADGDALRFEGDCPITFILAARTNYAMRYPDYRSGSTDPARQVTADSNAAARFQYPVLARRHADDYQALFDRVKLDLGGKMPRTTSTDKVRNNYGNGDAAADRALERLYFDYGRYLLISASRDGSLPANLQGVWNDKATPPWNADYHVNINLQMNYWPAESANLAETALPLFDFTDHLVTPGKLAAQRYFGAPGWTLFLNTNAWGYVGPIDWPTAFWQPEASAWLALHYYEHYLFGRSEAFLKDRAWPVMRGAAEFWLAALMTSRDGKLVVSPSYSPEHGPFTAGAAMSQQIVAELFTDTANVARSLGDRAFEQRLREALRKLDTGLRVGKWGQLQEWKEDLDDPKDDHRHVSHLFALYPGRAIDPGKTPELVAAARKTLEARGDASTGWSRAWKINSWARLRDGDRAHKLLVGLLRDSTLPNLWDTHPPFQIDGNFGATAGMVEMLLQSQNGVIDLLPALPREWARGHVSGIRARGDVTVDLAWDGCGLSEVSLQSGRGGAVSVRSSMFEKAFEAPVPLGGEGAVRSFTTKRGERYTFSRGAQVACEDVVH